MFQQLNRGAKITPSFFSCRNVLLFLWRSFEMYVLHSTAEHECWRIIQKRHAVAFSCQLLTRYCFLFQLQLPMNNGIFQAFAFKAYKALQHSSHQYNKTHSLLNPLHLAWFALTSSLLSCLFMILLVSVCLLCFVFFWLSCFSSLMWCRGNHSFLLNSIFHNK